MENYEARVTALEAEGMTRSDAQAAVDAEDLGREDYAQPGWIINPLSPYDIAAILQGGCASGAYMPAVTYHQAAETMAEHGNDVLQYIEDSYGELPAPPKGESWSGIAVFYLSIAVELFAQAHEALADWENDEEIGP